MRTPVSIGDGRATVTTSGTAVALTSSAQHVSAVTITALPTNTGLVWIGGPNVKAALGSQRGTPLSANDSFYIAVADLSQVYVDAATNGEGVTFTYTDNSFR